MFWGILMSIIRSLSTAVATSGLPLERGGSSVVGRGRSGCGESEREHSLSVSQLVSRLVGRSVGHLVSRSVSWLVSWSVSRSDTNLYYTPVRN
jgi:hypothetical protein